MGAVFAPDFIISMMSWLLQDTVVFVISGSLYIASGLVSILGLRDPLKFVPVLLLQLSYKVIWFLGVVLPLAIKGQLPTHRYLFAAIFLTYLVRDLIAIPFSYFLERVRQPRIRKECSQLTNNQKIRGR